MTAEVQWEEPPARSGHGSPRQDWPAIAKQLRSRPGQWAVVDTDCPPTTAANMRRGLNASFPIGEFEFRLHGVKKNRAEKMYARYVGVAS